MSSWKFSNEFHVKQSQTIPWFSETSARSWKLPSEEPGGSCLHQQLGGGEEVTIMAIWLAPSDEVSLTHDDVTYYTIYHLPSKIYLDVVVVDVEAAAMIRISSLLQLGEVSEEPCLGVLRHPCEGGAATSQDDSLANVDGTGRTKI